MVAVQRKTTAPVASATEVPHKFQWSDVVWRNVLIFAYMHLASAYAMYLLFAGQTKVSTFCLAYLYAWAGAFGITGGAHRLWSHGAYKANVPLRIFLMLLNCIAFQNSIHEWVRDHRVHHKFTDTNADPHNYSRGFFFAHMGWLMVKKHPDVLNKGRNIKMDDIEADGVAMFQKKYYFILMPIMSFILPTFGLGMWACGESLSSAWHTCGIWRYVVSLHLAWCINSAAHSWGDKPFDANIRPVDNKLLATFMHGEAWHNYHHVFPWDYKTSELGNYAHNYTTALIDFFAKIGWAYDLKTVHPDIVQKRAQRTGDNSSGQQAKTSTTGDSFEPAINYDDHVWGWSDQRFDENIKKAVTIIR